LDIDIAAARLFCQACLLFVHGDVLNCFQLLFSIFSLPLSCMNTTLFQSLLAYIRHVVPSV